MSSNPELETIDPSLWHINRGPRVLRILTPLSVVTTLAYFTRIAVKRCRSFGVGLDDWLTLVALMLSWGMYAIAVLFVTKAGLGRPQLVNIAVDPNRFILGRKLLFAGELLYASAITMSKLGILAMYRRLLPTRLTELGWLVLGSVSAAWWLAVVLVTIFQCSPPAKMFDPLGRSRESASGRCIDDTTFFVANSIPNIVTDIAILLLPTYQVHRLHLPRSQRVALVGIFMLGSGATATSIVRLGYHVALGQPQSSEGFTSAMLSSGLWSSIEIDMAITCSCLPFLKPLLTSFVNSRIVARLRPYPSTVSSPSRSRIMADYTIGGSPVAGSAGNRTTGLRNARYDEAANDIPWFKVGRPIPRRDEGQSLRADETLG